MANLLGAMIGYGIDRGDNEGGLKGLIIGTVAEKAIRGVAPIVATWGLGWAVQYGIRKGWHAITGADPVDEGGRLRPKAA